MGEELPDWLKSALERVQGGNADDLDQSEALMAMAEAGLGQVWTLVEDRLALFADLVGRVAPGELAEEEGKVTVAMEDYKVLHELARMVVQEAGLRALKKGKDGGE
ncbi:MAG: hypothetical protein ACYS47_13315 [Planctomycetota bacterium]